MQNLWEKERKGLFRELYRQYLDEGYDQKEANQRILQSSEHVQ